MSKPRIFIVVVLCLLLLISSIAMSASDEFGPWGRRGHHRDKRYSAAEPVAIALIAAGLAGIGIYALKRKKKD